MKRSAVLVGLVATILSAMGLLSCSEQAEADPPLESCGTSAPSTRPVSKEATKALEGEWIVTTPESVRTAKYFDVEIATATSAERRVELERLRDLNIGRVATIVRVTESYMTFFRPPLAEDAKDALIPAQQYVVVCANEVEVEVNFGEYDGGRSVLGLNGPNELYSRDLVGFARGTTWRRAGTPGAGVAGPPDPWDLERLRYRMGGKP